jgi:hypothetical protein
MGALISTVGTRYLVNHLNRAFSSPRIEQLRSDPPKVAPTGSALPAGSLIMDYFNDNTIDLLWLSQQLKHDHSRRGDNKCFLPEDMGRSTKTEQRWVYFLTKTNPNVLTQANHDLIRKAIFRALSHDFTHIEFDCVDVSQEGGAAAQTVLSANERDDHGRKYMKIVLVTPPLPDNRGGGIAGLPVLDKQPHE